MRGKQQVMINELTLFLIFKIIAYKQHLIINKGHDQCMLAGL